MTTENNVLVSIIIPCYNDAKYIEESINSALNQTYPNREIIVVDDGSNYATKAVLKRLKHKITRLVTQENQGQSSARNVGIRNASGNYIIVLDSDDYFENTFCEKAINIILNKNEVKLVSCYAYLLNTSKNKFIYKPKGGDLKSFLISNNSLGSVLFKKLDWETAKGYDEKMRQGFEDWEFYIRLLKFGGRAYVIEEPLFNYRVRLDSTTSRANKNKYTLLKYIYIKHKDLYVRDYESFVNHLLGKLEVEEREKNKNIQRIEFKLGKIILKPMRLVKLLFK